MKVQRFEELKCWQAARQLVKMVYTISRTGELARDFETKNQFRKSALSSMNNIAEGFGRFSRKDFIRFWIFPRVPPLKCKVCFMY